MRRRNFTQRPEFFRINYNNSYADGLVLAGLCANPGSARYFDSSVYNRAHYLTNMNPESDYVYDSKLNRFCIDFDGTDDYITFLTNPLAGQKCMTIGGWFYKTADVGFQSLCSMWGSIIPDDAFILGYESPIGTLVCYACDGTNSNNATKAGMLTGVWQYATGTFNGYTGAITAYINGVPGTPTMSLVTSINTTNGYNVYNGIGRHATYEWNGRIADLMIWNRVLTDYEIKSLADPSNVMLNGLLQPPQRRYYKVGYRPSKKFTKLGRLVLSGYF